MHHESYWYRIDIRDLWQPLAERTPDRVTTNSTTGGDMNMIFWKNDDGEWVPMGPFTKFTIEPITQPAVRRPSALRAMLRRQTLWFMAWQRRNGVNHE